MRFASRLGTLLAAAWASTFGVRPADLKAPARFTDLQDPTVRYHAPLRWRTGTVTRRYFHKLKARRRMRNRMARKSRQINRRRGA